MKRLIFVCLTILLSVNLHAEEVAWQDYASARAMETDKPLFVFAEMQFCSSCQKMKRDVFSQADVVDYLNAHFVPVKEKSYGVFKVAFDDLQDAYGNALKVKGYPALMVVQGDRYRIMYGYQDPEKLKMMLEMMVKHMES